jgi:hypothetical protein
VKRESKTAVRTAGALTAVPLALARLGAPALAGTALVVLIVVAALCWIIADAGRSGRLAILIDASRGNGRQGQRALPAAGADRREVR